MSQIPPRKLSKGPRCAGALDLNGRALSAATLATPLIEAGHGGLDKDVSQRVILETIQRARVPYPRLSVFVVKL